MIASHYLDAYAAAPDAEDAAEIRARAQAALVRAGERADSLGAAGEAVRYFVLASELTGDALERAGLLERAGWLNVSVPDFPGAEQRLAEAIAICEEEGEPRAAARISGRLAIVESWQGKSDDAIPRAEAAFATLERFEPGEEMAALAATLASGYSFLGENGRRRSRRRSWRSSSPRRSGRRSSSCEPSAPRPSRPTARVHTRRSHSGSTSWP